MLVIVCAWCGKERRPDGSWAPRAAHDPTRPRAARDAGEAVTHGMCPECLAVFEASGIGSALPDRGVPARSGEKASEA